MKPINIKDPSIAKEKYKWSDEIKIRVNYEKWTQFIDYNDDYYTWFEKTEDGIFREEHLNEIPEKFRKGAMEQLNKCQALAEFNFKKGWYEIVVDFNKDLGFISTNFMRKVTKKHLLKLLDMANYLDAHLLNNGNEIIDKRFIEELK